MSERRLAAVDLGATSGRVMVGAFNTAPTPGFHLHQVARFPNTPTRQPTGLHWDLPTLMGHIRTGLTTAATESPLASVGIDSWAVDYALITPTGTSLPFHYRDTRTTTGVETVHAKIPFEELYARNGLQFLPFNTIYQLATEPQETLNSADRALLIPDLVAYLLTGQQRTEYTNASTTGLLSTTGTWDTTLMTHLSIPPHLFPPLIHPGEQIGTITDPHLPTLTGTPVIAVGSHDTASAIAAIPMDPTTAAYISCGTWGLVGVETPHPITTNAARQANFTNEAGVDGTNRFLHNIMGLWLLNESITTWNTDNPSPTPVDLPALITEAATLTPPKTGWIFDVNDPIFLPPGNIPARIHTWFTNRGHQPPHTQAQIIRSIIESLANAFATAIHTASDLSGINVTTIHIVGGGSLNTLLCQRTADITGKTVLAGPVEATAIGNLLTQARHHQWIGPHLTDIRDVVSRSVAPQKYFPKPG